MTNLTPPPDGVPRFRTDRARHPIAEAVWRAMGFAVESPEAERGYETILPTVPPVEHRSQVSNLRECFGVIA